METAPIPKIGPRAFQGRARLVARWTRFAYQSAVQGHFDFCLEATRAIGWTLNAGIQDLSAPGANPVVCNICGWTGKRFYPNVGPGYSEWEELCPGCRAIGRHRALLLALARKTPMFTRDCRVIEVAPMRALQAVYTQIEKVDYTSFDLERYAMEQGDITAMRFPNDHADYFICFHVLEHIPDEQQALAEIRRVLKPGGTLVVQVPIDPNVSKSYEYDAPDPREVGHVRRYGTDFRSHIEKHGFRVQELCVTDFAKPDEITRYRLNDSSIYLAEKRADVRSPAVR